MVKFLKKFTNERTITKLGKLDDYTYFVREDEYYSDNVIDLVKKKVSGDSCFHFTDMNKNTVNDSEAISANSYVVELKLSFDLTKALCESCKNNYLISYLDLQCGDWFVRQNCYFDAVEKYAGIKYSNKRFYPVNASSVEFVDDTEDTFKDAYVYLLQGTVTISNRDCIEEITQLKALVQEEEEDEGW